jgi:hypothetical protein
MPKAALAASLIMACLGLMAAPVAAQDAFPWFGDEEQADPAGGWTRPPRRHARTAKDYGRRGPKTSVASSNRETGRFDIANPERPLFVIVSIADQRVSIYNRRGLVARSAISTGTADHPTPKGIFTIIGRERYHVSNIYSDAPMPFMQRITWSGVAMHLGVVPGHPASHGCIRLPASFAARLWGLTRIGERVVIAPHEAAPVEFAHPLLPAPRLRPRTEANVTEPAPDGPEASAVAAQSPLVNPHQYAERLKAKAAANAAAAAKLVRESATAVSAKQQESVRATAELKLAEYRYRDAEVGRFTNDDGSGPEGDPAATGRLNSSVPPLAVASEKLEIARAVASAKQTEVAEAIRGFNDAKAISDAAASAEKDASRRLMPVSVLISKKDRRIYVRQGLASVFDAPIVVRDPETPLGSHLYIATAAQDDGTSLKWSVVSLPSQTARQPWDAQWASSPDEALERVEVDQDTRDRIAERLWTGASLIISDQPLSGETGGDGTDVTVKLD